MNLPLQLIFFSLLCLYAQAWALKRPTQYEQWKALDQPKNRDLFLRALQSYFSSKGIHVERTAPLFVWVPRNHNNIGMDEAQEEPDVVVLEPVANE